LCYIFGAAVAYPDFPKWVGGGYIAFWAHTIILKYIDNKNQLPILITTNLIRSTGRETWLPGLLEPFSLLLHGS